MSKSPKSLIALVMAVFLSGIWGIELSKREYVKKQRELDKFASSQFQTKLRDKSENGALTIEAINYFFNTARSIVNDTNSSEVVGIVKSVVVFPGQEQGFSDSDEFNPRRINGYSSEDESLIRTYQLWSRPFVKTPQLHPTGGACKIYDRVWAYNVYIHSNENFPDIGSVVSFPRKPLNNTTETSTLWVQPRFREDGSVSGRGIINYNLGSPNPIKTIKKMEIGK